jgi:hypothetical protein
MVMMFVHVEAMVSELVEHVKLLKIYRNKIYLKPLAERCKQNFYGRARVHHGVRHGHGHGLNLTCGHTDEIVSENGVGPKVDTGYAITAVTGLRLLWKVSGMVDALPRRAEPLLWRKDSNQRRMYAQDDFHGHCRLHLEEGAGTHGQPGTGAAAPPLLNMAATK